MTYYQHTEYISPTLSTYAHSMGAERELTIRQHLDALLLIVVVLCRASLVSGKLGPICIGCALSC